MGSNCINIADLVPEGFSNYEIYRGLKPFRQVENVQYVLVTMDLTGVSNHPIALMACAEF